MENITDYSISSGSWSDEFSINCEDLTNNGLYFIFTGYIVPLLSPRVRAYITEVMTTIKNVGNVAGKAVSVTEYGFEKVQGLSTNAEMIDFIKNVCSKKNITIKPQELVDLAWSFSGDTENGKREGVEQTWNKLIKEIDRIHALNISNKRP
tara:strand:- start:3315 stop:3767 length:453 start_codon:yes stop_codon:yes gene_type:complete